VFTARYELGLQTRQLHSRPLKVKDAVGNTDCIMFYYWIEKE
jgi:hypothetical protein